MESPGCLDAGANSQVVLIARWHLLAGEEGSPVRSGRTVVRERADTAGYEALAGAMSATVAPLAREIAVVIPAGAKGSGRGS